MSSIRRIDKGHALTFATVAVLGLGVALALAAKYRSNARDELSPLERSLAEHTGLTIFPGSAQWTDGSFHLGLPSALVAHELVFLAAFAPSAPNDLFRADVRVDNRERAVAVSGLCNLSNSSDGDDYLLAVNPPYAATATRAFGQVRVVSVFDFSGQRFDTEEGWTVITRSLARASDFLATRHFRGVGRTTLTFQRPPEAVVLAFRGDSLVLDWKDPDGTLQTAALDLKSGQTDAHVLAVVREERLPKQPVLWLVDTARALPWFGPGPIEWAEGRFFALRDHYRRLAYGLFGDAKDNSASGEDSGSGSRMSMHRAVAAVPAGLEVGALEVPVAWPPSPLAPPVFKDLSRGEGEWQPALPEFVKTLEGAPIPVYRTFIRPDHERPYVKVLLLAMDMRQLELRMEGGIEDPISATGVRGEGRLPRDPTVMPRVIAVFNGAFKAEHGAYGMMVDRKIILPPQDDAATIATLSDGRVFMGTWPAGAPIPDRIQSLRQNMEPLLAGGVVNPSGRRMWGFPVKSTYYTQADIDSEAAPAGATPGAPNGAPAANAHTMNNMYTIRSGLCRTPDGSLIYAWGEDLSAMTLGTAMKAAGCDYGVHLDMNPYHTAYIFYHFEDEIDPAHLPKFEAEVAIREAIYSPLRYVNAAPKDFFYVALKSPGGLGTGWSKEGLAQPAPSFLPAVYKSEQSGTTLYAIDLDRTLSELAPGEVPNSPGYTPRAASERLLVEVLLGPWSKERGQIVRSAIVSALAPDRMVLVQSADGRVDIQPWSGKLKQVSLFPDALEVKPLAKLAPSMKAVALGLLNARYLVVGEGTVRTLDAALVAVGVHDAVAVTGPLDGPALVVRNKDGMSDGHGNPVSQLEGGSASLRFYAAPRPLGVGALTALFGATPSAAESKVEPPQIAGAH